MSSSDEVSRSGFVRAMTEDDLAAVRAAIAREEAARRARSESGKFTAQPKPTTDGPSGTHPADSTGASLAPGLPTAMEPVLSGECGIARTPGAPAPTPSTEKPGVEKKNADIGPCSLAFGSGGC